MSRLEPVATPSTSLMLDFQRFHVDSSVIVPTCRRRDRKTPSDADASSVFRRQRWSFRTLEMFFRNLVAGAVIAGDEVFGPGIWLSAPRWALPGDATGASIAEN